MSNNAKIFNNLKVHTQYSICEGAIKIDELAEHCKKNKIKTIGLADSYNLCGALEFSEKLSKIGTHPIIGTQINLNSKNVTGKITLYATSENGYKNLNKHSVNLSKAVLKPLISILNRFLVIFTFHFFIFFL